MPLKLGRSFSKPDDFPDYLYHFPLEESLSFGAGGVKVGSSYIK